MIARAQVAAKVANDRKIVIVNQAVNYLTIGFANAFNQCFSHVALITGGLHIQGEKLDSDVEVCSINKWCERPAWRKSLSYFVALTRTWLLLLTRFRKYEVLFISVPPMAYLLNLVLPHRCSMIIWDVYPDVFKITGMQESHPVYRGWAALNRRSFRRAQCIFTISEPMAESLKSYVSQDRLIVHPIWSIFQENLRVHRTKNTFVDEHGLDGKFIVQYSGNIGVTHNVEVLIDIAELVKDDERILIQIIGRGPRLPTIEAEIRRRNLANVQLLPFQSDAMFPYSLSAADLGVVVLHDSVSRGSVPSKAYNLMSFGIPALYVASSDSELSRYAHEFGNAECFDSQDLESIAAFIRRALVDTEFHADMQRRTEQAAALFRRSNADRFVNSYLETTNTQ